MNVIELTEKIKSKCKKLGVKFVQLSFSGGDDTGYLHVSLGNSKDDMEVYHPEGTDMAKLQQDIEEWAWETYGYSGAGDGNTYGDEIVYDLEKNKASHTTWAMVRREDRPTNFEF